MKAAAEQRASAHDEEIAKLKEIAEQRDSAHAAEIASLHALQ